MKKLIYTVLLIFSSIIYTSKINCAAAPAELNRKHEVGVYDAFEGKNLGIQLYDVPVINGTVYAHDIIKAYCSRWRRISEKQVLIKYNTNLETNRYDEDSDSAQKCLRFKSCKVGDINRFNLFLVRRIADRIQVEQFEEAEKYARKLKKQERRKRQLSNEHREDAEEKEAVEV